MQSSKSIVPAKISQLNFNDNNINNNSHNKNELINSKKQD